MAQMYNMAVDWTYDLFMEDAERLKDAPATYKGESEREEFVLWFTRWAKDFEAKWNESHEGQYDREDGYIGDVFASKLGDFFSDYYKDAYGQRPHLGNWFYVQAVGFPMDEDVIRTFCRRPVEDAKECAKMCREDL